MKAEFAFVCDYIYSIAYYRSVAIAIHVYIALVFYNPQVMLCVNDHSIGTPDTSPWVYTLYILTA